MKRAIVTGANGFIGTSLLKVMSDAGIQTFAVVRSKASKIDKIIDLPNVNIVYCEMDNIEQLSEMIPDRDIDVCIHLAWEGASGDARADYTLQLKNVEYALKLVDTVAEMGVKRYVGAGTLAEKDVLNYHPTDGATPNAVSIYGIAKMTTHFMTKAECSKQGIEHCWCYLSNTYGVGNTTNNFVNMASKKMLNGERAAFTAGEQTYDFVYITDTVRALWAVAESGKKNTAYYLGSTKQRKLKEYIKTIRDTIDPNTELFLGEIPFNGIPLEDSAYDTTKLVNDTGYQPTVAFEDGIKLTVDWLRQEKG